MLEKTILVIQMHLLSVQIECVTFIRIRGGYRVRQVRQLTNFSFNRHNDMRLYNASNKCPLGNCDNKYRRIDLCLSLSLRSSASLKRICRNSSGHKTLSLCFQGKKRGVPKPFCATVLTVKGTKFIGFWYPHPTNFDGSVSL